jgi:excisionase family DNA binding protein
LTKPLDISPALYDVRTAAAFLSLSRSRVYELSNDGVLTAYRIGGKVVFKRAELEKFIDGLPPAPIKHNREAA